MKSLKKVKRLYFAGSRVGSGASTQSENCENGVCCWLMNVLGTSDENCDSADNSEDFENAICC